MNKARPSRFRNILISGLPGAGKSTFARSYAQLSRTEFVELDKYVERLAGKSIAEIFDKDGEAAFRELEANCLERLLKRQRCTIALGGGTLTHLRSLQLAQELGCIVLLTASMREIAERLWDQRQSRPLLKDCDSIAALEQRLEELWNARKESYLAADLILETSHSSIDNLKIELAWLERQILAVHEVPDMRSEASLVRAIPLADPNYRSPREQRGGAEIVDKMERILKAQKQKDRGERKDRRDKKPQKSMRGDAPQARTDGPQPRTDGPQPRTDGPQPRTDGPQARTDGPQPRTDGPRSRTNGPQPRGEGGPHLRLENAESRADGSRRRRDRSRGRSESRYNSEGRGPVSSAPQPHSSSEKLSATVQEPNERSKD